MDGNVRVNSVYARIISYGSFHDGLTELNQGIDYIWDSDNEEIELKSAKDILSKEQLKQITYIGKRYILTPMIAWGTETFTDIGKLGTDTGQWNNDEDIEDDLSSGDFNFEFALSKIPYNITNGIKASFAWGEVYEIPTQSIRIVYQSGYEYGVEKEYRDNRIKRHENGHGCYVVQASVPADLTYSNITEDDITSFTVSYPYLTGNYYLVEYLEDCDYGIAGRVLREQNTFSTPNRVSQRDMGYYGVQIETRWPRGREPDNS